MSSKKDSTKPPTLYALVVFAGFLLSGFSIWYAWHPRHSFEVLPESKMEIVEGKHFMNESVEIDGKLFSRCTFVNVRLVYHARKNFSLRNNEFNGPIVFSSDYDPSSATAVSLLLLLQEARLTPRDRAGVENSGGIVMYPTENKDSQQRGF